MVYVFRVKSGFRVLFLVSSIFGDYLVIFYDDEIVFCSYFFYIVFRVLVSYGGFVVSL